ncbi:Piwi domain protein [Aphelenchoides fujianensis]|nr:Piwi domain protein [Aphelenchoides fujianensis]
MELPIRHQQAPLARDAPDHSKTEEVDKNAPASPLVHHYRVAGRLLFDVDGEQSALAFGTARDENTLGFESARVARRVLVLLQSIHPQWTPPVGRCVFDGGADLFALEPVREGAQHVEIALTAAEWPALPLFFDGAVRVDFALQRTARRVPLDELLAAIAEDADEKQVDALRLQLATVVNALGKPSAPSTTAQPRGAKSAIPHEFEGYWKTLALGTAVTLGGGGGDASSAAEQSGSVTVDEHVHAPPALQFADGRVQTDGRKGGWTGGAFVAPARVPLWAFFVLRREDDVGGNDLTDDEADRFLLAFVRECRRKRMAIGEPTDRRSVLVPSGRRELKELDAIFEQLDKAACRFALVITGPQDASIHPTLKFCGQKHRVKTQNVVAPIARQAAGLGQRANRATLDCIVNKANLKCGGFNYRLLSDEAKHRLSDGDLFIGLTLSFPIEKPQAEGAEPKKAVVVGFAANTRENAFDFAGDFCFQSTYRDGRVREAGRIVGRFVESFARGRGRPPARVFVFRNGVSQGLFSQLLKSEVAAVEEVLRPLDVPLVFLIADRVKNARLPVKTAGAGSSSSTSRTNSTSSSPANTTLSTPPLPFDHFTLRQDAHSDAKKIPRFVVLSNRAGCSMEELERTAFFLCFAHQKGHSATSAPVPVVVAREMARRGRALFDTAAANGVPVPRHDAEDGEQPAGPSGLQSTAEQQDAALE